MSGRLIPLADAAAWRGALSGVPHAFAHTRESCQAMRLTSGWETFLYAFESDGVRIVCPLAERTERRDGEAVDVVTPFGFSGFVGDGDHPGFAARWRAFAAARGYVCGYIGLNPLLQNPTHFDAGEAQAANEVFALDLTLTEEELFARLSENRKREVRRFARVVAGEGGGLVFDRARLLDFFLANYIEFFRERGASPAYLFSRATLEHLFGLEEVLAVGVERGGAVDAVSLFAHTPYAADFLFNVSRPEGQRWSAALLWHAVQWYRALGVPALCLGGGIRPGDGVARFKERFGARRLPLLGLKQVYRPEIYERLCRRAGVDSDPRTGYFPPYRDPRRAVASPAFS
jgi:hypothetical protein